MDRWKNIKRSRLSLFIYLFSLVLSIYSVILVFACLLSWINWWMMSFFLGTNVNGTNKKKLSFEWNEHKICMNENESIRICRTDLQLITHYVNIIKYQVKKWKKTTNRKKSNLFWFWFWLHRFSLSKRIEKGRKNRSQLADMKSDHFWPTQSSPETDS